MISLLANDDGYGNGGYKSVSTCNSRAAVALFLGVPDDVWISWSVSGVEVGLNGLKKQMIYRS